jgi:hypothetical protein
LPGTDLYAEVKDQLITHEYDFFDFIHTLLPTALPLKQFYSEYRNLFRRAISPKNGMGFLRKYPLGDVVPTLVKSFRWNMRLRRAHLDYKETRVVPRGDVVGTPSPP